MVLSFTIIRCLKIEAMKETESHIIKPRDFAEIVKAPNADLVADFWSSHCL